MEQELEIIFENDDLVAINKPHGLMVHRSKLARDVKIFALQLLRDQLNQHVYPCHRLDRKTSGVLLFAKSSEANSSIQKLFQERQVHKTYQAIVRGFTEEKGTIDYALNNEGKIQEAFTKYVLVKHFEINLPHGKHNTSRYSLINIYPTTGRFHQIRKHMSHIFHPILGDRPHGCNKQNKLWKSTFNMTTMMLHAKNLSLESEEYGSIAIEAPISLEFQITIDLLQMKNFSEHNG